MKNTGRYIPSALLWALPLLLIVPNVLLDITEQYYGVASRIANVALPLGVYLLLAALSRKVGRTALFMIPIMVLCAFQIVLIYLYGESIIAIDMFLNVVTTNHHEVAELLSNLGLAIAFVCILYLPPLIAGIVLCVKKQYAGKAERRRAGAAGLVCFCAGLVAFAAAFLNSDGYKPARELFPVNVCYNMGVACHRAELVREYKATSADFRFVAHADIDSVPPVIVFVIGETSRAGNWQLNGYGRETNPRLSRRANLVSFGKALSESNTTHKSVPLLMSHLTAEHFGDSIYNVKSVISTFGEAGYCTAWISNQLHIRSLAGFFGEEADNVFFLTEDGRCHLDMELCRPLERFVSENQDEPLFAVLHTYGSHFNYTERYPAEYSRFKPAVDMRASRRNRTQLINAYDNTILYIDAMLDSVASILDRSGRPAAMLYLADHGEDIFDDRRERFLHASPTPTYWQLHVPMILWLSDSYVAEHPGRSAAARKHQSLDVSSSRSAFHTLLSLGSVTAPVYDAAAALTEESYTVPERLYLNDYNEGVKLSRAGLRKPDFERLEAKNIGY